MKKFLSLYGSWGTRLLGFAVILQALGSAGVALFDENAATMIHWSEFWFAITTGWGIMIARQNSVTSAQLGLNPNNQTMTKQELAALANPLTTSEKEKIKKFTEQLNNEP